jgi:hypothetical protein
MAHQSMGHALKEIWRVLVPGGTLIDLRPLSANSPVEVIAGEQIQLAGRIDDSHDIPDDLAANQALAQLVSQGWFSCERQETFRFISYWNTPDELKAYLEEKRSSIIVPETVLLEARRLLANSGQQARLRIPSTMLIARYQKHQP